MDDKPKALVGSLPCDSHPPSVPSTKMPCFKCGTDCWVSLDMIEELTTVEGYALEDIHVACFYTCLVVEGDPIVTDKQRELLRQRGINDEALAETLELVNNIVQRKEQP